MKFRVICQKTSTGAHSPIQVVEQSTGKGVAMDQSLPGPRVCPPPRRQVPLQLCAQPVALRALVGERSSYRRDLCGGPHRIDSARLPALPVQPATSAFCFHHQRPRRLLPIALSAISSPMLPVRSRTASISPSCTAGRWAWDAPGSNSADSECGSPGSTSFLSRSMKWRASGPVFETLATWPSSA